MNRRLSLLALRFVSGLGPSRFRRLLAHFHDVETLLAAGAEALSGVEGIGPAVAQEIGRPESFEQAEKALDQAEKLGLSIVVYGDPDYPPRLTEIFDPPLALWVKGRLPDSDQPALAVVGMRAASSYGLWAADHLARRLAERGVPIVSGMARGIDTAAHQGALEAGGETVAVLGTGADVVYPPENHRLYQAIAEKGAVVSEFVPGTEPNPGHFPRRNRVISGLCQGVIVVEAGEKSGALITALSALDQGRDVYAVPGEIRSMKSRGTHRLIQQGAKLVGSVEDILSELPGWASSQSPSVQSAPKDMDEDESVVWEALGADLLHIDTLAVKCQRCTSEIMSILLGMELKGWVRQLPGMLFKRNP